MAKDKPLIIDDSTDNDILFPSEKGRGYEPRDFLAHPPEMFAPPSEMDLIPESEWDARIDEEEEQESSLEHFRLRGVGNGGRIIPSLDQGNIGYCHDDKTEVLTDKGWKYWTDYNWSDLLATMSTDTGLMEFQAPFQKHVYEFDGEMVYSTHDRVNFAVTPDHRMLVRKWDESRRTLSDNFTFQKAGEIGWYAGLPNAPTGHLGAELVELEVEGDRRYDGDDFLALLGLIVSDGYAGGTDKTKNLVSFASFREGTRPAIAALAARLGFKEAPSRPGVWNRWDAGALANWIRANCYTGDLGSHNKKVPDLVKVASTRQIKHFLHYFDDRNRSASQFYSSSKHLIDDLQELHLRIGKRSRISLSRAKETIFDGKVIRSTRGYVLVVRESNQLSIERGQHIQRDRYKGPVFCAAVPNGTLITRRNGTVLISGNCWGHSVTHAMILERMVSNQPYIPLSAYSVCAIIKKGRDQGGWCGLAAEFCKQHGVAPQSLWPQGNRDYKKLDTTLMRNAMRKHRIGEDWVDLSRPVYYRNLTFRQVVSCLLNKRACALDFNWWGHSVCGIRVVRIERGSYGIKIWNSWGDRWGTSGMGILRGDKMIPDGAIAVRSTTVS